MAALKNIWSKLRGRLKKIRRRTWVLAIIGILVLLLPTALAIGWVLNVDTPTEKPSFSVVLFDQDREQIATSTASEDPTNGSNLADVLYRAITEGQQTSRFPFLPEDGIPLYVTADHNGTASEYTCYFSSSDLESFYLTTDGRIFLITRAAASDFLNLPEAECLYRTARAPILSTNTLDTVIPATAEWFYRAYGGDFRQARDYEATEELRTYEFAGALELDFDNEPTSCYVHAVEQHTGKTVYEGTDRHALEKITVSPDSVLEIHLRMEWSYSPKASNYGSLTYDFLAVLRDRAAFSINRSEIANGEFFLLKCTNIRNSGKLSISCEPELPRFLYQKGDTAYCVIPYPEDSTVNGLQITATYGASIEHFTLTLRGERQPGSFTLPHLNDTIRVAFAESAQEELAARLASPPAALSDTVYFRGNILSLIDHGFTKGYEFGSQILPPFSEDSVVAKGTEYLAPVGTQIPVLASGEVVATAWSEALGNYVVVNHGLGIETWYAHLSDFDVRVGDILAEGQSVGKAGIGGLHSGSGVLVLCTVNGHLCNPASLKK